MSITLKRARSLPPQQRAESDCGIEINTLPKLPGAPEENEYFLTVNAIEGYYGYALRSWDGITDYIGEAIVEVKLETKVYVDKAIGESENRMRIYVDEVVDDIVEDDPVFMSSPAASIENSDIDRWNTPEPPFIETDPLFIASPAFTIKQDDIDRWNTPTVTPGFQAVLDKDSVLTKDNTIDLSTKVFSFINGKVAIGTNTPLAQSTVHVVNPTTSAFLFVTGRSDGSQYANLGLYANPASGGAAFFTLRADISGAGIMTTNNQSSYFYSFMFRLNGTGALVADKNVSSGPIQADPSAQLEIRLSLRGFLMPRLSTTERTNIGNPATGLLIYNNSTHTFDFRSPTGWQSLGTGNALTSNPLSQFAVTTSAQLKGVMADATGNGFLVFSDSPVFTTGITAPVIYGGSAGGGDLQLYSTSDANKGKIKFGDFSYVDGSTGAIYSNVLVNTQITITTSVSIDTTTTAAGGLTQNGRNVVIDNGASAINYNVNATDGFCVSFVKRGTATITFVAGAGRTLIQVDGTNLLNGAAGSTAMISSVGVIDYLRVSNA